LKLRLEELAGHGNVVMHANRALFFIDP
jgi:hypothetical protein